MVLGEDSAHARLQDLLRYYSGSPLSPYGETLSQPLARQVRTPHRHPDPPPPPGTHARPRPAPLLKQSAGHRTRALTLSHPDKTAQVPPLPTNLLGKPLEKDACGGRESLSEQPRHRDMIG